MKEQITAGLAALGLLDKVPACAPEQLERYGQMLLEKNQVMNLTAITDPDQVVRLHMLDCAALLTCTGLEDKRLIDVGTGAGFPGMVLKILVPSLEVVLLDSLNKRLDWLKEVADALSLSGIETLHARAEEQSLKPGFRDSFDIVTSRAVASLELLGELCLPYVKPGGFFLAMKSVDSDLELSRAAAGISRLGGVLRPSVDYTIPGTDITHRVIMVEKTAPTPRDTLENGLKYRNPLFADFSQISFAPFLFCSPFCTKIILFAIEFFLIP